MDDNEAREVCDAAIATTARMLVEQAGVPVEILLDRLLTFAGAHAVVRQGTAGAAEAFHTMARNISRGCYRSITGEAGGLH